VGLSPAGATRRQQRLRLANPQKFLNRPAAPTRNWIGSRRSCWRELCGCSSQNRAVVGLGTDHRELNSRH